MDRLSVGGEENVVRIINGCFKTDCVWGKGGCLKYDQIL